MSTISGKCDICGKDMLSLTKTKKMYSYHKLGEQNICGVMKYSVFTYDVCDLCYNKIADFVDTLKPKEDPDPFKEAFK